MKNSILILITTICVIVMSTVPASADIYPDGMVSCWKFDETSGNTAYDFLGNNDGKVHNELWTTGMFDGALDFRNGTWKKNNVVVVPYNGSLDFTGEVTVEAWLYGKNLGDWDNVLINSSYAYPYWYDNGYGMYYYDGAINFYVGHMEKYFAFAPFSQNEWHHVVGTYDGTTIRVYVDGEEGEPYIYTNGVANIEFPMLIGGSCGYQYWGGFMDEIAIYDRALGFEEIQQHYIQGDSSYCFAFPDDMLYSVEPSGAIERLIVIDPDTAEVQTVLMLTGHTGFSSTSLAFSPDGRLFGWDTTHSKLYRVDIFSGNISYVSDGPELYKAVNGLAFDGYGNLYGLHGNTDELLSIDPGTGDISVIGNLGIDIKHNGLAIDFETNQLYGISGKGTDADFLFRIDKNSGLAEIIGPLGVNTGSVGAEFDPVTGELFTIRGSRNLMKVNINSGEASFVGTIAANTVNLAAVWPASSAEDNDEDGFINRQDNCPYIFNTGQYDSDDDGVGDACDNCLIKYNAWQEDSDNDGIGDSCDSCSNASNPDQADADEDGVGDACDICPSFYDPEQTDTDDNGVGDACDAYWLKASSIDMLEEAKEGMDCRTKTMRYRGRTYTRYIGKCAIRDINRVIRAIDRSLTPAYWIDENSLNPEPGRDSGIKVFQYERRAVSYCIKGPNRVVDPVCYNVTDNLVAADYLLAQTAIDEASAADMDPDNRKCAERELKKAEKHMDKAEQLLDKTHYASAISQYRNAWSKAQNSLDYSSGEKKCETERSRKWNRWSRPWYSYWFR